jgi:hypothetical protein
MSEKCQELTYRFRFQDIGANVFGFELVFREAPKSSLSECVCRGHSMKLFRTAATIVFTLISFSAAATDYLAPRGIMIWRYLFALAGALVAMHVFYSAPCEARIVRIEVTRVEPAFGGQTFGDVGAYERVIGRAYGEVDPSVPANATIQDIGLAPKNAKGFVEYVTDIDILRPVDRAKGNGILFFEPPNRGNKFGLHWFNADVPFNRCRPESGWNLEWRILRSHEGIVSGGKVNWLIGWFCCEGLPAIDLSHVDLS